MRVCACVCEELTEHKQTGIFFHTSLKSSSTRTERCLMQLALTAAVLTLGCPVDVALRNKVITNTRLRSFFFHFSYILTHLCQFEWDAIICQIYLFSFCLLISFPFVFSACVCMRCPSKNLTKNNQKQQYLQLYSPLFFSFTVLLYLSLGFVFFHFLSALSPFFF